MPASLYIDIEIPDVTDFFKVKPQGGFSAEEILQVLDDNMWMEVYRELLESTVGQKIDGCGMGPGGIDFSFWFESVAEAQAARKRIKAVDKLKNITIRLVKHK